MFEQVEQHKKELNQIARQLEKEGFNIWVNDPQFQGVGFKVIFNNVFVEVSYIVNYTMPNYFIITLHKKHHKHPNILDAFMCEELKKEKVENINKVYDFIKKVY